MPKTSFPTDRADAAAAPFAPFPNLAAAKSAFDGSIVDRFDAVVRRFPTRLAISDAKQSLTYSELASLVERIAMAVAAATKERAGPVAIFGANDALYAAATLGALAAGRGYVPMDADYPPERNRLIAAHAGATAVITAGDRVEQVQNLVPAGVPVVNIATAKAAPDVKPPLPRPGANDLAHILYTSGSTGTPKGVYQNHQGCLHAILQRTRALQLTHEDRLALFHSPTTVDGARITLAALLNGASLHVLPPANGSLPALAKQIRDRGITVCHAVPTLFRHLFASALTERDRFDSVRVVHLSGERVDWNDLHLVERCCGRGARLMVAFGSTETSASCAQWFVDEKIERTSSQLPVGGEVADFRVAIVDHDGRPVEDGAVGEIVVSSRSIALGYWRDPELTARAFAVDASDPGRRTFKTGDFGRRRPDGLLEFLGRKDHQIKLRGHRIELTEIESSIRDCEGIGDAAVLARHADSGRPLALVAYIALRPGVRGLLPRHIQAILARRLPRHMVPSQVIMLGELPRLPNFKIDRIGLAELDAARPIEMRDRLDDPLLDEVAGIFEAAIGASGVTADDTLASIGGDSLQAVIVAAELERRYAVAIPDHLIEGHPTIREIARWLRTGLSAAAQ